MSWIDRAKDLRDRFTDLLTKHGKGLEVFWVYAPPKRGASRINLEEFPRFLSLDEAVTVSFNQAGSLWVFGDQAAWKSWLSLAGLALSVLKAPEAKEVVKVLPDVRGEVEVLLLACFKILRPPKFCFHKDSTVERKSLREFQTVFPGDAPKRFNRRRWWAKLDVIEATVLVLDRLIEAAQLASAPTLPAVSAQEAPVTAESQPEPFSESPPPPPPPPEVHTGEDGLRKYDRALGFLSMVATEDSTPEIVRKIQKILDSKESANQKLYELEKIAPIPLKLSPGRIGKCLKVSRQAIRKTRWWEERKRADDEEFEDARSRLNERSYRTEPGSFRNYE